jgi:hypothetical protein
VRWDFMKYIRKSRYERYIEIYKRFKLNEINETDILNITGIDVHRLKEYINNKESCREVVI